jgi:hypothetical protein
MSVNQERLNDWNIERKHALELIVNCYKAQDKTTQEMLPYYIGRAALMLEMRDRFCRLGFDMEKII